MFKPSNPNQKFSRPEGAGNYDNMDDFNFVKSISLMQGTVDHVPAQNKDIVNKQYVDAAGGGDVSKVGTPVDNEIAVWTGDGTIEGDTNFKWDGDTLDISGKVDVDMTDNTAEAWKLYQGSNGYISCDTTNGSEIIRLGCGPTDPSLQVKINSVEADVINEIAAGGGVTIDGVLIKDGEVDGIDIATDVTANTAARHAESHTIVSHSDTTATGAELNTLTGGGDTTLHDHDGISENTSARHTQDTDTALGSGCVAADHGTAATDQVVNVCYGTGSPPTANTTTIGTLFIKYTA